MSNVFFILLKVLLFCILYCLVLAGITFIGFIIYHKDKSGKFNDCHISKSDDEEQYRIVQEMARKEKERKEILKRIKEKRKTKWKRFFNKITNIFK